MPFFKLQRPREFKIETYYYQPKDDDYDPKRQNVASAFAGSGITKGRQRPILCIY